MNIVSLLVTLVSGAIGGNAAGAAMPEKSLGPIGNSLAGLLGGGLGAGVLQVFGVMASGGSGVDFGSVISDIAGGGVGGGIAMAVIGAIRSAMNQKA